MVMKAELKRIHCRDIFNSEKFYPDQKNVFGILLQVMVSPENGEGEQSFDVMLCTPEC